MNILGINGWYTRSHDPSACIVRDGRIVAMAEEERFIREKHAFERVPINAITYCLSASGISANDVDVVAFGWDYKRKYTLRGIEWNYDPDDLLNIIFPKSVFHYKKRPGLEIVPHHLAHAASTFFSSGFHDSTILVIDGQGEDASTTIAYGEGRRIQILRTFPIRDSLGYFFESINKYIGFHYLDSGKTMGLAPYGKPVFTFNNISNNAKGYSVHLPKTLRYNKKHLDEQEDLVRIWYLVLKKFISTPNRTTTKNSPSLVKKGEMLIGQEYKNLAASGQKQLEHVTEHLARIACAMTGSDNLALSGGVALNCSMNGKLQSNKNIHDLYIFPCANDAGVSAGAALYVSSLFERNVRFKRMEDTYLGPSYSNEQIENVLISKRISHRLSTNVTKETALLLSKNKVVGWFQGRMEVGPRALGNRSILASPIQKSMWRKVNRIKGRESWRPLAPSILYEKSAEFFGSKLYSPFMIKSFIVNKSKQKTIPAVVHLDGSTRPQTVMKKTNPKYWRLIHEFHSITGVPVLLNTSFNGPVEPIVCSPDDALKCFFNCGLDYLILNDYIVGKKRA